MAEGGDDQNENPYLYQNFLKPSNKNKTEIGIDEEYEKTSIENYSDPDLGIPRKKETNKIIIVEDEKILRREENPFSMKQFLKRDHGARSKSKDKIKAVISETNGYTRHSLSVNETGGNGGINSNSSKIPDFATGLPDFVQDHFLIEHTLRDISPSSFENEDKLPDFTLQAPLPVDSLSPGDDIKLLPVSTVSVDTTNKTKHRHSSNFPSSNESIISKSLPDFLSDGPMLNTHKELEVSELGSMSLVNRTKDISINENNSSFTENLKRENCSLRKQLHETNAALTAANARINALTEELNSLNSKESEETRTLEKVVQQVENNLECTLQRAVSAENTVTKLKQEVKSLQSKLASLYAENEALKCGDTHLINMKEKASIASQQLNSAATNAETLLRELLSGIDSLKLLASYLSTIDKITEDNDKNEDKT